MNKPQASSERQNLKLLSIKQLQNLTPSRVNIEVTEHHSQNYERQSALSLNRSLRQIRDLHMQRLVRGMKVEQLVRQFVYKVSKNIKKNPQNHYDIIQKSISQTKTQDQFLQPIQIHQNYIALLMALDVVCILIIQTLSTFQGFYPLYRSLDSVNIGTILLQIICLLVFLSKIFIGFTTAKYASGIRFKYMVFVAQYYAKSILFVFDFLNFLLTFFKIIFPRESTVGVICFVVSVLCLPVLSRDFQIIETAFARNLRKKQYFSMMKILIFNLFFAQFVSTILLAVSFYDPDRNWMTKAIENGNMDQNLTWWQQYFYAIYWAIVTIATVGYGDLTPSNFVETIVVSICMLFGSIVFSFNITSIGSIIQNLRNIDQKRKQQIVIFKRMAQDQNISLGLQDKILDYVYKSTQMRSQFEFNERKQFLQKLPAQLRDQFNTQYAKNIFSKIPFFRYLQRQTLVKLSLKFKSQIFYPGQEIVQTNGKLRSIMILKQGGIGFAYDKLGSNLNGLILQKGQIHNHQHTPYLINRHLLNLDQHLNYQILAISYCFMLILEHQDFHQILKQQKHDNELYFQMLNKIEYLEQDWDVFSCQYCFSCKHTVFQCPKIHYMPYKSIVVQRHLFSNSKCQTRDELFIREQGDRHGIRHRSALNLWKTCFNSRELKWQLTYQKNSLKHFNQQTVQNQQQIQKLITQETQQQVEKNDQEMKHDLAIKVSENVLKKHCCELNLLLQKQKQFQMDTMHNFVRFFTQHNPQKLVRIGFKQHHLLTQINRLNSITSSSVHLEMN